MCDPRVQPYWFALYQRRAEKGCFVTYLKLLPYTQAFFITSLTQRLLGTKWHHSRSSFFLLATLMRWFSAECEKRYIFNIGILFFPLSASHHHVHTGKMEKEAGWLYNTGMRRSKHGCTCVNRCQCKSPKRSPARACVFGRLSRKAFTSSSRSAEVSGSRHSTTVQAQRRFSTFLTTAGSKASRHFLLLASALSITGMAMLVAPSAFSFLKTSSHASSTRVLNPLSAAWGTDTMRMLCEAVTWSPWVAAAVLHRSIIVRGWGGGPTSLA